MQFLFKGICCCFCSCGCCRKELFKEFDLKITEEIIHQSVNFLDITLNLCDDNYLPNRKPNNYPVFINRRSNHPPLITKKLPSSVDKRISHLSSNKEAFSKSAPLYEAALKRSNYETNLHYSLTSCTKPKTRTRKVIWFNPPFSSNVRADVSRTFLNLINKHFSATNTLQKIFIRNSVKVSYSCMDNCKSIISKHNFSILSKRKKMTKPATNNNPNNRLTPPTHVPPSSGNCNCRNSNKCL